MIFKLSKKELFSDNGTFIKKLHCPYLIRWKNMSTIDRLKTMESLWDSLIEDENDISSPDWHRDVLADRKLKIENGEAEFISIKDLKAKHR